MDHRALIARLRPLPDALEALLRDLPHEDWRWRPPEGGWSILEIVNHLVDEETDDFRTRVSSTIEDPSRPWPGMDPEGAVTERRYQERDPADSLRRFRDERARSLAWLDGLTDARWENEYHHPRGPLRAGDLLASWTAHDARHLQQIAKRLYALATRDGQPYSVLYAG